MRQQLIMVDNFIKLQQYQPEQVQHQIVSLSLNQSNHNNRNRVGWFNSKVMVLITRAFVFIITLYIAVQIITTFLQHRNLKLLLSYPIQTVGLPQVGQMFNYTQVQQKYQFENILVELLQPYSSTNCQQHKYADISLCSNLIQSSTAIIGFERQSQNSHLYCQLQDWYNLTSYINVCKGSLSNQCMSTIVNGQCLGQVSDKIFLTHYRPYNQIISQFKLTNKHLIVKMSVQQTEWASFRSMPLTELDFIDQLVLQIDLNHGYLWGNIDTIKTIMTKFYPVSLHMDSRYCRSDSIIQNKKGRFESDVFSVTLVNKNIIKLTSKQRSFKPNKNSDQVIANPKDCQMPHQTFQVAQLPVQIIQIPWTDQNLHSLTLEHVHGTTVYNQPTVGMRIANTAFDFTKIQQNDRIEYYNYIAQLFKPYNQTNCQYARYGDPYDQGYVICRNMLSHSVALLNFGIEGKDSFGCQVSTQFRIPNLQYDCTSQNKPFCRHNNNGNYYYYACISQRTQNIPTLNRTYYSIRDVIDRHNLNHKHITLKIDIEGNEWPSLRSLPVSYLDYIDQLIIQIHLFQNPGYFKGNYHILQTLGEMFYSVNLHQNNYNCWMHSKSKLKSSVFEVTLVNKKLLQLHSRNRSFKPNHLNQANARHIGDCQIE